MSVSKSQVSRPLPGPTPGLPAQAPAAPHKAQAPAAPAVKTPANISAQGALGDVTPIQKTQGPVVSSGVTTGHGANAAAAVKERPPVKATAEFDYVVVGSGAGGGPTAARLAEAGYKVLAVAVGLWWRVLPWALPLAWLLAALPCAAYADLLLYRRVATLGASLAAYVAEHQVPPQTLQDVGASFVPNSELRDLQLKAGVIDLVLAVKGASGRRLPEQRSSLRRGQPRHLLQGVDLGRILSCLARLPRRSRSSKAQAEKQSRFRPILKIPAREMA